MDLGPSAASGDPRRRQRAANLAALAELARLLRLKGLGGIVAIDLVGKGHDGAALAKAAGEAFAPDQPGVSIGPISRFGVMELQSPWRSRPLSEILLDAEGRPTSLTAGFALLRAIERGGWVGRACRGPLQPRPSTPPSRPTPYASRTGSAPVSRSPPMRR